MLASHSYKHGMRGWDGERVLEHHHSLENTTTKYGKFCCLTSQDQSWSLLIPNAAQDCSREPCCISHVLWQTAFLFTSKKGQSCLCCWMPTVHVETLASPPGREASHGREICSLSDACFLRWSDWPCSSLWIMWIRISNISYYHF